MTSIRKTVWNTYRVTGYTYQAGNDPRATGGVHLHQVRLNKGRWQRRTVDSNGTFRSCGPVETLMDVEGEDKFETANGRGR